MTDAASLAAHLLAAEADRRAVGSISHDDASALLTVDDAYAVQDAVVAAKVADGDRVVGAKLGLVSKAKQQAMGVDEPVYGWLTERMTMAHGESLDLGWLIHPRVEPEIVFVLAEDLAGPGITAGDVLDATAHVCAGLEVIDSRYVGFTFTLEDVIADNTSAARFALGDGRAAPRDVELPLLGCVLRRDGEVVETAAGAAVMGDPAEAVAMLANFLARRGQWLERGWTILSGGLTAPTALAPGTDVTATFHSLGTVSVRANP